MKSSVLEEIRDTVILSVMIALFSFVIFWVAVIGLIISIFSTNRQNRHA